MPIETFDEDESFDLDSFHDETGIDFNGGGDE